MINHQWADIAVLQAQAQKFRFQMFVDSLNNRLQLHSQRMSNRTKTHFENTLPILQMFRSMIVHAKTMALACFQPRFSHLLEPAGIIYVSATALVIEVEVNLQGASITRTEIACVAIRCHVGAVTHQII